MPKENRTRFAILGLLTHQPLSGYDIKKRIEHSIAYFWKAGYGQIYPTLKQLEDEELVRINQSDNSGKPDRKVYEITASGKEKLRIWLASPTEPEIIRYELLLKLFFGSIIPTEKHLKNISDFRSANVQNHKTMAEYESNLRKVLNISDDHLYYLLTVLFGKHLYQAYINWADEATALLNQNANIGKE